MEAGKIPLPVSPVLLSQSRCSMLTRAIAWARTSSPLVADTVGATVNQTEAVRPRGSVIEMAPATVSFRSRGSMAPVGPWNRVHLSEADFGAVRGTGNGAPAQLALAPASPATKGRSVTVSLVR